MAESGADQSTDEPSLYEKTIDEQLDDLVVECGTHGELPSNEISVGFDGKLHCSFCSLNQEIDVRNKRDIDSTVDVQLPSGGESQ